MDPRKTDTALSNLCVVTCRSLLDDVGVAPSVGTSYDGEII